MTQSSHRNMCRGAFLCPHLIPSSSPSRLSQAHKQSKPFFSWAPKTERRHPLVHATEVSKDLSHNKQRTRRGLYGDLRRFQDKSDRTQFSLSEADLQPSKMQLCGFLRAAMCTAVIVVVLAQSSHSLPGSTFHVSAWVTSFDPHCCSLIMFF